MYDEAQQQMNVVAGSGLGGAIARPMKPQYDPSIRENLENRIKEHQKCISDLEAIRDKIPESLIDMKISDLREAMRF